MSGDTSPPPDGDTLTTRLAAAWAGTTYDAIPAPTRERARLILLDSLGTMLSASRPIFPGVGRFAAFVRAERDGGPCRIVGTDLRTGAVNAALMNGFLGYALDNESHHGPAIMHAPAIMAGAAYSVAQERQAEGPAFLAAYILGIDVACRASLALGPNDLYARGFHPTAIGGAFGAAAAAGLLLGLDAEGMERAMGLAATQASGLLAWASDHSEESRPFNPGLAARNGVTAAKLAAVGFGAPRGIFDASAKYNVFRAWSLDGRGSPERLTEGQGRRFATDELIIKRYASCAFTHPALDGLLSILQEEGITASEIESITMRYPSSGAPIIDNNPLRSHRAQYILPLAAVRGKVLFEDVVFDRSSEEAIARLAAATTLVYDDELDRLYPERYTTIVEVAARGRGVHSRRVDYAKGCLEKPMAPEEIVAKYRDLAGQRVDAERVERILALVENLERPGAFRELCEALVA